MTHAILRLHLLVGSKGGHHGCRVPPIVQARSKCIARVRWLKCLTSSYEKSVRKALYAQIRCCNRPADVHHRTTYTLSSSVSCCVDGWMALSLRLMCVGGTVESQCLSTDCTVSFVSESL